MHNWQIPAYRLQQCLNVPGYNFCNVLEVLVRDQERNYPLIVNVANRRTCARDNVKATWQSNTKANLATLEPLEKANNSKKCIHYKYTSLLFQTLFSSIYTSWNFNDDNDAINGERWRSCSDSMFCWAHFLKYDINVSSWLIMQLVMISIDTWINQNWWWTLDVCNSDY